MGLTHARIGIESVFSPSKRKEIELLVDTGAMLTTVPAVLLRELGITPNQRLDFELADGRVIQRDVGEARLTFDGRKAVSPIIFGENADAGVLGVVALEAMALEVGPVRKEIRPTRLIMY